MNRPSYIIPDLRDYPDLRQALNAELSKTAGCNTCQQATIYNKYNRLARQRRLQSAERNNP
jgi:hypothetical protein